MTVKMTKHSHWKENKGRKIALNNFNNKDNNNMYNKSIFDNGELAKIHLRRGLKVMRRLSRAGLVLEAMLHFKYSMLHIVVKSYAHRSHYLMI